MEAASNKNMSWRGGTFYYVWDASHTLQFCTRCEPAHSLEWPHFAAFTRTLGLYTERNNNNNRAPRTWKVQQWQGKTSLWEETVTPEV